MPASEAILADGPDGGPPDQGMPGTSGAVRSYLTDPLLGAMWQRIRRAGAIRSAVVDITNVCNIRCTGCYYFSHGQEQTPVGDDNAFASFVAGEQARGTNFITVLGGEPSLALDRIKTLQDHFRIMVASNGIRRIPLEGFEHTRIGLSVWGDHDSDTQLRGGGRVDVFARALANYRNDPRVLWYYSVSAGNAGEVARVVEQCVENGNTVMFNFYGDIEHLGGAYDHRSGFDDTRQAIFDAMARFPEQILMPAHVATVVSSGQLYGETWGHAVCPNLTPNHPMNVERITNGKPYSKHFRAYTADLVTTKRCCAGDTASCSTCMDTWSHLPWIMLNMRKYLGSVEEFSNWLAAAYWTYVIAGFIEGSDIEPLVALNQRLRNSPARPQSPQFVALEL